MQALKLGADSYLAKPADTDQILAAYRDLEPERENPSNHSAFAGEVEWEHIQRVLSDCSGNITQAANFSAFIAGRCSESCKYPPSV
jgi:two-component system response regulator RegA